MVCRRVIFAARRVFTILETRGPSPAHRAEKKRYSFESMRVELKLETGPGAAASEIPWNDSDGGVAGAASGKDMGFLDLRETPRLIERIAAAREFAPLRAFLGAVNERDSLFYTARSKISRAAAGTDQEFSARVEIAFASDALNANRMEWGQVAGQLSELLTRESGGETVSLELRLRPCQYKARGQDGFSMEMELRAWGASAEQAQMRGGLGLARVQQALLFISRAMRQRLG
jgi:hypothetical protein